MRGFDAVTTMELLILAVLWGSGIYRVTITLRQPWALWRASFTTAMILLPLATTIHFYRAEVSSLLQLPNAGGLLTRVFLTLAGICVVIYVDTLKDDSIAAYRLRRHLTVGGIAIFVIVVAWIAAPIHGAELAGLSAYATHPAVAVHNLTFYAYLAVVLGLVVRFCSREIRESGRAAIVKKVSLTFIGLGCALGLPVVFVFSVATVVPAITQAQTPAVSTAVLIAARFAPVALGLIAVGVLSLLVLPIAIDYYLLQWRWRRLRPLWTSLMQRNPELRLGPTHRPIGIHDLQLREQRILIEIHDVLQRIPVPVSPDRGPDVLARLLVDEPPVLEMQVATQPASNVLRPSTDYEGDRAQILALAKTWGRPAEHARSVV